MKKKRSTSNFIRETCIAGPVIDVTVKFSNRGPRSTRASKSNPSREAVIKYNTRTAEKKLARLLNANFYPGDFHCTLTYEGIEPEIAEAKKELENFIRRMKREYKKQGLEFKWIAVTEFHHKRIHHHIVMSYIDERVIARQWRRGHVNFKGLGRNRNYRKLAEYLVKETSKTMSEPGSEIKKRWSASRNLVRPIIKREIVNPSALHETPKALKGYDIDMESVHKYQHPFTGIEHLEYMMCSTDPVPRIKTWRKGEIVKRDETYRRSLEVQIDMESLDGWDFI